MFNTASQPNRQDFGVLAVFGEITSLRNLVTD
jgi:hypothetical protein